MTDWRHRYERARYRLLRGIPLLGRTAYLRYDHHLVAREVVVADPAEARWVVWELGGRVRYVAAHLYARRGDVAMPAGSVR